MCQILNEAVGDNLNGSVEYEAPETPMTDEQIALYSAALYAGIVSQYNLSVEMYTTTARYLVEGLKEGFKDTFSPLYKSLEQSLYHFSAAKQYTQNRQILSNFVAPLEEYSYNEFKDVADQILHDYNKAYLKTEWNTAVANSQSARDWDMLMQDDTIEFIEYRTQEDGRVRPEHAALNLARYPKKSSFWNTYFPPNGWNCFTPETKVLTSIGWKEIQFINPFDKVIGGSGKEQTVISVHKNPFNGMLIRIKVGERFISCTPNHRFLTTRGWVMAKNITTDMILVQDIKSFAGVNKVVRYINDFNTIIANVRKSIKAHGFSYTLKAFDSQIKRGDININPMMRGVMIMYSLYIKFFKKIKDYLLSSSWISKAKSMSFGVFSKKFFTRFSTLSNNFGSIKRRTFLKFKSYFGASSSFHWMNVMLVKVGEKLFRPFTLSFSPIGVPFPLDSNSFSSCSSLDAKFSHHIDNLSSLDIPSLHNLSISESLLNIEVEEGFTSGAPLDRFDSIEDFFRSSLISHKFNSIDSITNIPLNADVYNLEVENDNSYITEIGITHNCRCFTVNYDQDTTENPIVNAPEWGTNEMPTVFKHNPGKEKIIFPNAHPYFRVAQGDKVFREANYGMPMP